MSSPPSDEKSTSSDSPGQEPNSPAVDMERDPKAVALERELFKRLASIRQFPIAPDPVPPEEPQQK